MSEPNASMPIISQLQYRSEVGVHAFAMISPTTSFDGAESKVDDRLFSNTRADVLPTLKCNYATLFEEPLRVSIGCFATRGM